MSNRFEYQEHLDLLTTCRLPINNFNQAWVHFLEHRDKTIRYVCDAGEIQFDIRPLPSERTSYQVWITHLFLHSGEASRIWLRGMLAFVIDSFGQPDSDHLNELRLNHCASRYDFLELNQFRHGIEIFQKDGDDLLLVTAPDPSDLQEW